MEGANYTFKVHKFIKYKNKRQFKNLLNTNLELKN